MAKKYRSSTARLKERIEDVKKYCRDFDKGVVDGDGNRMKGKEFIWCRGCYIPGKSDNAAVKGFWEQNFLEADENDEDAVDNAE